MNAKPKIKTGTWKQDNVFIATILFLVVVCIAVFIPIIISTNSQLPASRDVFTLYSTYNMTVVVVFDKEPPIVQFIAPNGTNVDMQNIRYRPGSNFIQYFLPNAMVGTWRMVYDPLSNTEITTPYSVYMAHIFVRDFGVEIAELENGYIPVSFEVSSDNAGEFNYELHAVFTAEDNSIASEILMSHGLGTLNETHRMLINIGCINNKGGFMLRLSAYVQYGQASIRDTAWLDLRLTLHN